jgi:hypothetical protein
MINIYTDNKTILLGDFVYNSNEFVDYLASENITLYLNKFPFVNKNCIVDRLIRTIRDKLNINEIFWLDSMYMLWIVEEYNNIK